MTEPASETLTDAEADAPPPTELTLPLDAWHRAKGGRMVPFAGYSMPVQYEGIMAEHLWTRSSAGLFDVSHMGQLLIVGEGAIAAFERVVPGDMAASKPGRLRYSLLLADDGGILDDLMATRLVGPEAAFGDEADEHAERLYVVVNGAVKQEDIGYLRETLPDAVTLRHLEDQALLALQGPKAVDALARIVPGVEALVFLQGAAFEHEGTPIWISRSGYTGEDGFEISLPAEIAERLADALCAQAEVKPIGLGARDSLRLEAGLPLYGHDLDSSVDPIEGDLGFAVNKARRERGDFLGADRILAAHRDGAARKRVGLAVEGRMPVREGAPIFAGTDEVGRVTSGGFAPSVGAPIAMGFVVSAHASPGTALEAEVRGKRVPLTVAPLPFVPHNYVRKAKGD